LYFTRLVFQRALAFIYLIGFCIAVNQYVGLLGEHGIQPIRWYFAERSAAAKHEPLLLQASLRDGQTTVVDVAQVHATADNFWDTPSIFWWTQSDGAIRLISWSGLLLALFALSGFSERYGHAVSTATWLVMWLLYQSLVNAGQVFYGFGWEMLLLETGFLALFLGSRDTRAPAIVMWLILWAAFRIMFGAGMIKLRGDPCWRDLTCMQYHYETQPSPNPLSWYFHHTPLWFHKGEVLFNHFVELAVPFFYFTPGKVRRWAGALTIVFQFILILSGNLSWLNYITIILCIPCFDDRLFAKLFRREPPETPPIGPARMVLLTLLACMVGLLSLFGPVLNLVSERQSMNQSFYPFHLVNTYGAFGSITRDRDEIVIEGTDSEIPDELARWEEYEFKGKPGTVTRRPSIASPYHYKLDWQMWFAAMGPPQYQSWIFPFVARLLQNEPTVTGLLAKNPFPDRPPKFIRAKLYRYRYTDWGEVSGAWWKRELRGEYLPPLALKQ
jgi:hypothetical protein